MRILKRAFLAAPLLVCAGCSTPQIALDHANNGVGLTQELQKELVRYRENARLAADRRMAAVRAQEASALKNERERAMDDYLDAASGRATVWQGSRTRLLEAHRQYARLLSEEEKAVTELAERLAAASKELPAPGDKLGAVQKALADLGTELSPSQRIAVIKKFLAEGKAIVDKNAKSDEAAASAAPADQPQ